MTALAEIRAELVSNERQWEAFRAPGHCMVVAPPGSGKTKLLTARLAQDFLGEIGEPHGAACITYSNSAAEELDRRLLLLGVQRRSNLFVGTVHGFALNCVIRPYAAIVGLDDVVDATVASASVSSKRRCTASMTGASTSTAWTRPWHAAGVTWSSATTRCSEANAWHG